MQEQMLQFQQTIKTQKEELDILKNVKQMIPPEAPLFSQSLATPNSSAEFTPLKKSISTADEFSCKQPVSALNEAPLRGADSNLHLYKQNTPVIEKEEESALEKAIKQNLKSKSVPEINITI